MVPPLSIASSPTMRTLAPRSRAPQLTELRFQYQPIVALRTDEPGWSEALVRWELADGTVRGPLDILPHWLAATRHELFTRFTLEHAAKAIASTPEALVSVNLSPAQIMHPGTVQTLEKLLPEVRARLRIELTEQRVYDTAALWDALTMVRERSEVVLLDDVTPADLDRRVRDGAPIDGVKIDRSAIALLLDAERREQVRAFIRDVAQRFPIVVAEGIEDAAVCEDLYAMGASHVQGFGIAKPSRRLLGSPLLERLAPPFAGRRPNECLNVGAIFEGSPPSDLKD